MSAAKPTTWWQTLAAVPRSKHAHDHWATCTDGRWRPYDRLRRVWADQTSPNDGLHLPHTERHLTCSLFENFVMHAPATWLPRLCAAARLDFAPNGIVDAAWSYEFEQCHAGTRRSEKIADVVIHLRDAGGDALVAIEAKNLGKELGNKDEDPAYYLDMRAFEFVPRQRRFLIYLVDEGRAARPKAIAAASTQWKVGVLTWQQLAGMQISLAEELVPGPAGAFIAAALQHQYLRHGIRPATPAKTHLDIAPAHGGLDVLAVTDGGDREDWSLRPASVDVDEDASDAGRPVIWRDPGGPGLSLERRLPETAPHVRDYVAGALQYLWCDQRTIEVSPAFPYLAKEPAFLECLVPQFQSGSERSETYWRLH